MTPSVSVQPRPTHSSTSSSGCIDFHFFFCSLFLLTCLYFQGLLQLLSSCPHSSDKVSGPVQQRDTQQPKYPFGIVKFRSTNPRLARKRLFSWSFRQLWMHDNGRASIESTFSLLSLIVFLIREEAWALWVVKSRRWRPHFSEGQLRSQQADWRLSEGVWFQRRKRSHCVFCAKQTKATGKKKTVRGDMLIFCRDRSPAAVIQSHENIVGWNEEEWANTTQNNQITSVVLVSTQPHKLPECWDLTSPFSENPLIHLEKNPIPTVFRYETLVSTEGGGSRQQRILLLLLLKASNAAAAVWV